MIGLLSSDSIKKIKSMVPFECCMLTLHSGFSWSLYFSSNPSTFDLSRVTLKLKSPNQKTLSKLAVKSTSTMKHNRSVITYLVWNFGKTDTHSFCDNFSPLWKSCKGRQGHSQDEANQGTCFSNILFLLFIFWRRKVKKLLHNVKFSKQTAACVIML